MHSFMRIVNDLAATNGTLEPNHEGPILLGGLYRNAVFGISVRLELEVGALIIGRDRVVLISTGIVKLDLKF